MTTNFSTADDFTTVADGFEAVTLLRRESLAGPGENIPHALRRAIDTAEVIDGNRKTIESDGRYTSADAAWNLPAVELTSPPRLGDVIEDAAGRRWTILETRLVALGSRWRLRTRELSIAYGLEDLIDILKAEYTQSESGAVETTWTVLYTGIRGRIQPLQTQITDKDSILKSVRRCRIILEEPFDLDHTNRLCGPDGSLYGITAVAGFPKLGELQTVDVEKIEASESPAFPSGVTLPEVPTGTVLTYAMDHGAETVHTPGDSLAVPEPAETVSAGPAIVGNTPVVFPTAAMGDVNLPLTIHRLTWRRVPSPPWTAIRECQGSLNESEFLGVPAGQLLFDGAKATPEVINMAEADDPQFGWRLDYRFREKPLLVNTPTPLVGTSDFSRLLTFEESE